MQCAPYYKGLLSTAEMERLRMYRRENPPAALLAEKTGQQRNQGDAHQSDTAASHELFHTQIGVGKRLDGGRRRVKKYLWSF